ncbi:MAG: peptidoglycan-binding protein, partial [Bacteroidales bacterium]|nr:peptidoglycan-binding protein [Bacteroidales bacterium]
INIEIVNPQPGDAIIPNSINNLYAVVYDKDKYYKIECGSVPRVVEVSESDDVILDHMIVWRAYHPATKKGIGCFLNGNQGRNVIWQAPPYITPVKIECWAMNDPLTYDIPLARSILVHTFPVDLKYEGLADIMEWIPGGLLPLNNDHDNGNPSVEDRTVNPVANEDDTGLLKIREWFRMLAPPGELKLEITPTDGSKLKVWDTSTKDNAKTLPLNSIPYPSGLDSTSNTDYWLEGVSGTQAREIEAHLSFRDSWSLNWVEIDRLALTVDDIEVDLKVDGKDDHAYLAENDNYDEDSNPAAPHDADNNDTDLNDEGGQSVIGSDDELYPVSLNISSNSGSADIFTDAEIWLEQKNNDGTPYGQVRVFAKNENTGVVTMKMNYNQAKSDDLVSYLLPSASSSFYVEGVSPGTLDLTLKYKKSGITVQDEVKVTVVKVDVDVHYDIDAQERQLTNDGISGGDKLYRMLSGMRVKLTATVEPEGVSAYGYNWQNTGGSFYATNYVNATNLTDTNLLELYWEGTIPSSLPHSDTITFNFTNTNCSKKLKINSRLLEHISPDMSGDDVKMLQDLLNYLGWLHLDVDGYYGNDAEGVINRFQKQNVGNWISGDKKVDVDEVKLLNYHYDDYRNARNAFGWNNGVNPDPANAVIYNSHASYNKATEEDDPGWVEAHAPILSNLPDGIITPVPTWRTDKECLIMAIVDKETNGRHWGVPEYGGDWCIMFSFGAPGIPDYGVGALGFVQMMPFNSNRYNGSGSLPSTTKIFQPDDTIKGGAQLLNPYLYNAFEYYRESEDGYTDDNEDCLSKALANYNSGSVGALSQHTWKYICENQSIPLQALEYAVKIKFALGLQLDSWENQYND